MREGRTSIPVERIPEYQVTTAKSKLYTVALDYFQLQVGISPLHLALRCTENCRNDPTHSRGETWLGGVWA